jgi:hypothetical protein
MNPSETIGMLEEYHQGLKDLVGALQANKNRRDVVALMQELVNRDIGRILGLGLPPNWQGEDKELLQRIKSILEDIRKDAELAGAFVGQEAIPPALDFLVSGIRLNVEGRLHVPFGVTSAGKAERTACPARKWWTFWRREGD